MTDMKFVNQKWNSIYSPLRTIYMRFGFAIFMLTLTLLIFGFGGLLTGILFLIVFGLAGGVCYIKNSIRVLQVSKKLLTVPKRRKYWAHIQNLSCSF